MANITVLLRMNISLHRGFQPLSQFTVSIYRPSLPPSLLPSFPPPLLPSLPPSLPPSLLPSLPKSLLPLVSLPQVLPTVTITPLVKVVDASDRAELVCECQSFPLPSVVWSREDSTSLQIREGFLDRVESMQRMYLNSRT